MPFAKKKIKFEFEFVRKKRQILTFNTKMKLARKLSIF